MAESNLHALDINLIAAMSEKDEESSPTQVSEICLLSPWYSDIVSILQNLSPPPRMAENKKSSNKSLVNIIKKLLETNKKSWHKTFVNALWENRVSQKKSISMSPFKLMYGVDTVFPTSLAVPVVKILKEVGSKDDHLQQRINQMIHLQQTTEEFFQNTFKLQERIKKIYDRKAKADKLEIEDIMLK
eukprot:PITA_04830